MSDRGRKWARQEKRGTVRLHMYNPMILVVDDDDDIRKVLATILDENGYEVDLAKDGAEALRKTNERQYDVVLIDVFLPDISGVELLARIQETKLGMRKVIMTGNPSLQNAVACLNNGAHAYIMKPIEIDKMLVTIQKQLNSLEKERKTAMEIFARGRLRGRIDTINRESAA